jgi:hypothetical protein
VNERWWQRLALSELIALEALSNPWKIAASFDSIQPGSFEAASNRKSQAFEDLRKPVAFRRRCDTVKKVHHAGVSIAMRTKIAWSISSSKIEDS